MLLDAASSSAMSYVHRGWVRRWYHLPIHLLLRLQRHPHMAEYSRLVVAIPSFANKISRRVAKYRLTSTGFENPALEKCVPDS